VGASRAVTPLVIGFFFLLYLVIAFFTDETLITLMAFTSRGGILAIILALIPVNIALRMVVETEGFLKLRRSMARRGAGEPSELFDETVELAASPIFSELERRIATLGYRTRCTGESLSAWRGISLFPSRLLLLAGMFCLFAGILISTTTKTVQRQMVVEGKPLPTPTGPTGMVERVALAPSSGSILSRTLTMEVASPDPGNGRRTFGLYPPSLHDGYFVYPRYLGLAAGLRFFAPDLPAGYESNSILNCYPPGKEDDKAIPGSPYRIVFSIPEPDPGNDRYVSYMSGNVTFRFKLLKGEQVLFTGSIPAGGEFARDGYRLALPDVRRLVVTDFIGDYGVLFIWGAGLFVLAAGTLWLPIRFILPRRELLFVFESGITKAYSRSEGGARKHSGIFHDALDYIDAKQ
jgi:hypothetical protein